MLGVAFVVADTQEERGGYYQRYVTSAARRPYFVGGHWFEYLDESFLGRHDGHESFNTGFVDVCDHPYPELAKAAAEVNTRIYEVLEK
jgi:agarase